MSFYNKFGFGSGSISQWETSYFGGYEKLLCDHPPVEVPLKIATVLPLYPKMYVPYNTRQKLINIFLLKLSSYDTTHSTFLYKETLKEVTIGDINYLKVPKNIIKSVLKELVSLETELGSLFSYYESFIIDTEYLFEVEKESPKQKYKSGSDESTSSEKSSDDNESDDESDGESDSESDGKSDSKITRKEYLKKVNDFAKALGEIKVGKTFYDLDKNTTITDDRLKKSTKFVQMRKRSVPCNYGKDEVKMSNSLLNLLDISFDPKSDRLNNLKMGKLDVSKIAEIPSGNTQVYYTIEENQSTKPFSVCILSDESGSMSGNKIRKQNKLLKVLFRTFRQILPSNKIFVFGHSGGRTPEIRIYNDMFFDGFEHTIDGQLDNSLDENYDGPVIEKVYERVRSQTSDNIIFISISDGYPAGSNYGGQVAVDGMKKIIEKCKRDGFVTVGIGIECGLVKEIYNYHIVVDSHSKEDKTMIGNISTLINRVVKTEFQS